MNETNLSKIERLLTEAQTAIYLTSNYSKYELFVRVADVRKALDETSDIKAFKQDIRFYTIDGLGLSGWGYECFVLVEDLNDCLK